MFTDDLNRAVKVNYVAPFEQFVPPSPNVLRTGGPNGPRAYLRDETTLDEF